MKRILILISFYLFVIAATAQITINVPAAGGFSSALAAAGGNAETITNLTVTGNINALDIKFMRENMPVLAVLDLTTVSILAYNGTDGPGGILISAYPANEMPAGAFNQKTSLTSIKLPSSILSIGSAAFLFCSGLTGELKIPGSVKSIGIYAFSDCSGFTGNLVIPESVPSIAMGVFRFCSGLTSVTIPGSVSFIDPYSFMQCTALQQIIVNNAIPPVVSFGVFEGVNTTTCEIVVPKGSIPAYQQVDNWKSFITITEGYKVQYNSLGGSVVSDALCYNARIPAPEAPTKLGYIFSGWYKEEACTNIWNFASDIVSADITLYAKWNVQNTYVINVTAAGGFNTALIKAGGNANAVVDLTLTGSIDARDIKFMRDNMPLLAVLDLSSVSIMAYNGTGGTFEDHNSVTAPSVNYPANEMPQMSFQDKTSLKSIKLPNSVTSIGKYAFYQCFGLTCNLIIPNSVKSIETNAFASTGFKGTLTIPNSVTSIEPGVFHSCDGFTGNLIIPNSVVSIKDGAFSDCNGFTGNLIIPNSVVSIEGNAFSNCSGFTGDLTIPNSVTSIGERAFLGCSGLTGSLTLSSSLKSMEYAIFSDCGFTGNLTIPNSVTCIPDYAFYNCSGFNGILTIPGSVTSIGESAFSGCSGFTGNLTIPNSIKTIESQVFYGCSGFSGNLTIPNSVTSIGLLAFYECSGFTGNLTIPNSVTSIGLLAFCGCRGLTGNLTIPGSVKYIGIEAFGKCSGLTGNLTIPNSITSIEPFVFYGCNGLTGLILPTSVSSIGNSAFTNCTALQQVTVNNTIPPVIYEKTFEGVDKKTCVLIVPKGSEMDYLQANYWNAFFDKPGFFRVQFNSLSGSAVCDAFVAINTLFKAPTNPTKEGYTFVGWCKEAECSNPWNFNTDIVTSNITLFAKWVQGIVVNVPTAGGFSTALATAGGNANTITNLTVTGNIDARDIKFMRDNMPKLSVLDLSSVSIIAYNGTDGTYFVRDPLTEDVTPINYPANELPDGSLSEKKSLTSIKLPNSILSIGKYVLDNCIGLSERLVIPNSVTKIGLYAFSGCSGFIGDLTIPNGVTSIGEYAFYSNQLTSITLPNSVTSIGGNAFNNNNLTSFVLPKAVKQGYIFDYWKDQNGTFYGAGDEVNNLVQIYTAVFRDLLLGDANCDGVVTINDALLVAQYTSGLITGEGNCIEQSCDVNKDGKINILDALLIAKIVAGVSPATVTKSAKEDSNQGSLEEFNTLLLSLGYEPMGHPTKESRVTNYPNPFNGETKIEYTLTKAAKINLDVFDITGKPVKQLICGEYKEAGVQSVLFNGNDLPSGTYFYKLRVDGKDISTKKMILHK